MLWGGGIRWGTVLSHVAAAAVSAPVRSQSVPSVQWVPITHTEGQSPGNGLLSLGGLPHQVPDTVQEDPL